MKSFFQISTRSFSLSSFPFIIDDKLAMSYSFGTSHCLIIIPFFLSLDSISSTGISSCVSRIAFSFSKSKEKLHWFDSLLKINCGSQLCLILLNNWSDLLRRQGQGQQISKQFIEIYESPTLNGIQFSINCSEPLPIYQKSHQLLEPTNKSLSLFWAISFSCSCCWTHSTKQRKFLFFLWSEYVLLLGHNPLTFPKWNLKF